MLVSTKGRYALRVMVDLAENGKDGFIPMKDVAQRQQISLKYLERILPSLVSGGMVEGLQGKGGGYRLTREPSSYTVAEILRLTEGGTAPVVCLECGAEVCPRRENCRTLPMWTELNNRISSYLESVTIADLMKNNG